MLNMIQSVGAGVRATTHTCTAAAPAWRSVRAISAAGGTGGHDVVDDGEASPPYLGAPLRLHGER
jgi:hypothetical protein